MGKLRVEEIEFANRLLRAQRARASKGERDEKKREEANRRLQIVTREKGASPRATRLREFQRLILISRSASRLPAN